MTDTSDTSAIPSRIAAMLRDALSCPPDAIELAVVTFVAGGHLLLEDVPGVGTFSSNTVSPLIDLKRNIDAGLYGSGIRLGRNESDGFAMEQRRHGGRVRRRRADEG